jgi:hypothetical protein
MNKRSFLILGLMLALNSFASAQKRYSRTPDPVPALNTNKASVSDDQDHPYGGTFQIICSKEAGKKEVFTTDLLKLIEDNRLESEEKILVLSPITKIRILSKQQISAPGFQPIEKLYSFE